MTDLPYMPLWIEPLLADTEHLTNAEFGAYMRLLCAMWRLGGSVPDDDRLLRRLVHADPRNWPALRDMLAQFVIREGGRITQKRLREIRTQQHAKREHTVDAAKQRWQKRDKPLKTNGRADAHAHAPASTAAVQRALAREPEQEEPTSQGDEGSGSPLPPHPARPPAVRASGLAGTVEHFTGPFMPSQPTGPKPASKPAFLKMIDEDWGGDFKAYNEWRAHQVATAAAIGQIDAAQSAQEEHSDERQRDRERTIDDDDLDDLIKF